MIAPTYSLCQRAIPSKTKPTRYRLRQNLQCILMNCKTAALQISFYRIEPLSNILYFEFLRLFLFVSVSLLPEKEEDACTCSAGFSRRIFRCFSCFQCIFPAAFRIFCLHSRLLRLHGFTVVPGSMANTGSTDRSARLPTKNSANNPHLRPMSASKLPVRLFVYVYT